MAKRVTLAQLIDKIQSRKLTQQEARNFFLVEPNAHRPFDFNTYINPEYVDVKNFESLALDADLLVSNISVATSVRKRATSRKKIAAHKIVAEGDSWFRLPQIWPVPKTCINFLQAWGYQINNLAQWGDTLDEITRLGEFWRPIDLGDDVLLFSAGGNDILGNGSLASFLNLFDVGHTRPSDAPYYVKREFFTNLDMVTAKLENEVIKPMDSRHANKKIIMHGYDYAIPRAGGPWLGSPMEYQGLHPTFNAGLCQAIVRLMIDAYNLKLAALASKYRNTFVHLDLRRTVGRREWFDELHGNDAAAKKIATKFAKAIDAVKFTAQERAVSRVYAVSAAA
jgi:hypothetical protein